MDTLPLWVIVVGFLGSIAGNVIQAVALVFGAARGKEIRELEAQKETLKTENGALKTQVKGLESTRPSTMMKDIEESTAFADAKIKSMDEEYQKLRASKQGTDKELAERDRELAERDRELAKWKKDVATLKRAESALVSISTSITKMTSAIVAATTTPAPEPPPFLRQIRKSVSTNIGRIQSPESVSTNEGRAP